MAKPNRKPLQVSPEFKRKLDELQRKIMMSKGEKPSLRELTEGIVASPFFQEIEKTLIKPDISGELRIKFDNRRIL